MQIERKAVMKALRTRFPDQQPVRMSLGSQPGSTNGLSHMRWRIGPFAVMQTGIGREAVVRALDEFAGAWSRTSEPRRVLVILAGACGGLTHTDDVPVISSIVDEHGHWWRCGEQWTDAQALAPEQHARNEGVTLVGVDRVVASPADKQRLAAQTGAAIVDMECHAFIQRCEHIARSSRIDLRWSIVRGVSDTPEETLPAEVVNWLDTDGNTLAARAVVDLIRRPGLVPHVLGVVRRSNRVLPKVGTRVAELCAAWTGEADA